MLAKALKRSWGTWEGCDEIRNVTIMMIEISKWMQLVMCVGH